jgi:hypothetical protein
VGRRGRASKFKVVEFKVVEGELRRRRERSSVFSSSCFFLLGFFSFVPTRHREKECVEISGLN